MRALQLIKIAISQYLTRSLSGGPDHIFDPFLNSRENSVQQTQPGPTQTLIDKPTTKESGFDSS